MSVPSGHSAPAQAPSNVIIKEESPIIRKCTKFNPFYRGWSDPSKAVTYLKLRKDGCNRHDAITFCSKANCKTDSTKVIDGPSNCRTLKTKKFDLVTYNGWHYMPPKYDLGKKFYSSPEDFLKIDDDEGALQKHFVENEQKIKNDFKRKLQILAQFYQKINQKYDFTNINKKNLLKKVKQLTEEQTKEEERKDKREFQFLKLGNIKLTNIVDEVLEEKKKYKDSLLRKLNVFPQLNYSKVRINPLIRPKTDTESNEEKITSPTKINGFSPDASRNSIMKRQNKSSMLAVTFIENDKKRISTIENEASSSPRSKKRSFSQGIPNSPTRRSMASDKMSFTLKLEEGIGGDEDLSEGEVSKIDETENAQTLKPEINLERLKAKSSMFIALEMQNKFIKKITEAENLEMELIQKNHSKKPKAETVSQSSHIAGFTTRNMLVNEFNSINYMYPMQKDSSPRRNGLSTLDGSPSNASKSPNKMKFRKSITFNIKNNFRNSFLEEEPNNNPENKDDRDAIYDYVFTKSTVEDMDSFEKDVKFEEDIKDYIKINIEKLNSKKVLQDVKIPSENLRSLLTFQKELNNKYYSRNVESPTSKQKINLSSSEKTSNHKREFSIGDNKSQLSTTTHSLFPGLRKLSIDTKSSSKDQGKGAKEDMFSKTTTSIPSVYPKINYKKKRKINKVPVYLSSKTIK